MENDELRRVIPDYLPEDWPDSNPIPTKEEWADALAEAAKYHARVAAETKTVAYVPLRDRRGKRRRLILPE